jgi:hypothetical protein
MLYICDEYPRCKMIAAERGQPKSGAVEEHYRTTGNRQMRRTTH